jgi:HD-GYP domain-containing protein (c-di-GMP phosphodiesterase class II)
MRRTVPRRRRRATTIDIAMTAATATETPDAAAPDPASPVQVSLARVLEAVLDALAEPGETNGVPSAPSSSAWVGHSPSKPPPPSVPTSVWRVLPVHPLLVTVAYAAYPERQVVIAPAQVWRSARALLAPWTTALATGQAVLVLLGAAPQMDPATRRIVSAVLPVQPGPQPFDPEGFRVAVERALELLDSRNRVDRQNRSVDRYRNEMGELLDVARAIATERDLSRLLDVILESSRKVTGADAGSVYVVEDGTPGAESPKTLRFKLSQNDSVSFASTEFTIPLNMGSIAGCAALERRAIAVDDAHNLPPDSPFGFDRRFDDKSGYRTRSMLAVPLVSHRDEVIGVIQLINKKRDPEVKLLSPADVDAHVVPFDVRASDLLGMVAAQAGVSLENTFLYEEIRRLFEGFVKASVEAIESRDPTTSGHSRRVADYTLNLARVVDGLTDGPFKHASFTREDLQEIEYASLLHDFGKIGVREKVLVKAKKLEDYELGVIRSRFDFVSRTFEAETLKKKLMALEAGAPREHLDALDRELALRRAELEGAYVAILGANEPTVLAAGDFARIEELARRTYLDLQGNAHPLLTASETVALSVKRGSLTEAEFDEIRSHVTHTYRFLQQIPWSKALKRVPLIAGAHHERLNGTGYPNRLAATDIPLQSKMMSIADIFDALTASDRPYKRAIPIEKALDILNFSVKDGHVDADLVKIFSAGKLWERPA